MDVFEAYENWIIHAPNHPSNKLLFLTYNKPDIVLAQERIKIWMF